MQNLPQYIDLETPSFIGIDEIHITREGKHRKQAWCLVCNGDKHTVMELLPNRNKPTIIDYFMKLKNRSAVKIVTMDMWQTYRDAVHTALPNAKIVIDKFHVVKMANHALNEYRKSFKAKLGRKRNLTLKQDRFVLLKREHKLPVFPHKVIRDAWFSEFPELKRAYELKEEFFKIYDCHSKSEALMKYKAWKASIPDNLEVFKEIVDTVDN